MNNVLDMSWQQHMQSADTAAAQGNLPAAEHFYWEALQSAEQFGGESAEVAETAGRLGDVLVRQSKYSDAEDLLLRLAQVTSRPAGPGNIGNANTLLKLAEIYYSQGKYDKAEPFGLTALRSYEIAHGASHSETTRIAGNVAYIFHAQSKFAQAEELYKRAIASKTKGNKYDAEATNLMRSYASLLEATHREGEAEHMMRCVQGLESGNWAVLPSESETLT